VHNYQRVDIVCALISFETLYYFNFSDTVTAVTCEVRSLAYPEGCQCGSDAIVSSDFFSNCVCLYVHKYIAYSLVSRESP